MKRLQRNLGGKNAEVTVYKGDEILCHGTVRECAAILGIQPETIYFYLMPSYQRRIERRKKSNPNNVRQVVLV